MNLPNQAQALMLLEAARRIACSRRLYEQACSYPVEYGGDEELVVHLKEFLDKPDIKEQLKIAMEMLAEKKY